MLRVNGRAYDWGDVDFQIPGLNIEVQEISYNDELEKEVVYGVGQRPRGYGEGNYKSEGKIDLDKAASRLCHQGIGAFVLLKQLWYAEEAERRKKINQRLPAIFMEAIQLRRPLNQVENPRQLIDR